MGFFYLQGENGLGRKWVGAIMGWGENGRGENGSGRKWVFLICRAKMGWGENGQGESRRGENRRGENREDPLHGTH